jgi:hypothetical protein
MLDEHEADIPGTSDPTTAMGRSRQAAVAPSPNTPPLAAARIPSRLAWSIRRPRSGTIRKRYRRGLLSSMVFSTILASAQAVGNGLLTRSTIAGRRPDVTARLTHGNVQTDGRDLDHGTLSFAVDRCRVETPQYRANPALALPIGTMLNDIQAVVTSPTPTSAPLERWSLASPSGCRPWTRVKRRRTETRR